jgi:hypothetical protein
MDKKLLDFILSSCLNAAGDPEEMWKSCGFVKPIVSRMNAAEEIAWVMKYLMYDAASIARSGIDPKLLLPRKNGKNSLSGLYTTVCLQ